MAAGDVVSGGPTSAFMSKLNALKGLFSGKKDLIIPKAGDLLAQSASNMGLSKTPITTSQPVSQQGANPATASTITQGSGATPLRSTITPGGGNVNAGGQTIVGAGAKNLGQPTEEQSPIGPQKTMEGLFSKVYSGLMSEIGRQDVDLKRKKFVVPGLMDYVTPDVDRMRQEAAAAEYARSRRGQTSDYQANMLNDLAAGERMDRAINTALQGVNESILRQRQDRFGQLEANRAQEVANENEMAEEENAAKKLDALEKQKRFKFWSETALDAIKGGTAEDRAQNQQTAEGYKQAEIALRTQKELDAKMKEFQGNLKTIDETANKTLTDLNTRYEQTTDPGVRQQLKDEYQRVNQQYQTQRKELTDQFEEYKKQLQYNQMSESLKAQTDINRFVSNNFGKFSQRLAKGGQLSASDQIAIEREKSRLKREEKRQEAELKKQNSLLLARVKKELEESAKNRERNEKLRFKLIESLIDTTK